MTPSIDEQYASIFTTMGYKEGLAYCEGMIQSVPDYENKTMWMGIRQKFIDSQKSNYSEPKYNVATDQTLVEGWKQ